VAFTDQDLHVADRASAGTTGQGGKAGQAIAGIAGSGAGKPLDAEGHRAYLVPEWVRVRAEDFGLLFYDTRSTKLTFVRSGDSLVAPAFTDSPRFLGVGAGGQGAGGEAPAGAAPSPAALARLLEDLVAKGLLVASEVE
jgi:putative mycofactocin binding protein MftB